MGFPDSDRQTGQSSSYCGQGPESSSSDRCIVVPSDTNIRKDYEKLKKYQGLEGEGMESKGQSDPVEIGALRAVTSKLGEWLQQILGMTSEPEECSDRNSEDPVQNLQTPRLLLEDPRWSKTQITQRSVKGIFMYISVIFFK